MVEYGTPETESLCRNVAETSGGVAILSFSRGKDSVAAWLYMRKFFPKIIPFHCASVPGLSYVDESLAYYEEFFKTPIIRYMDSECGGAVHRLWFQPVEDEDEIDRVGFWKYDKNELANLIRKKHGIQNAYCAFGINQSDSIDRQVRVKECQGRHDGVKSFYPCWNWSRAEIMRIIEENQVRLADDYLIACRSTAGLPGIRVLERMESVFPEDFRKVRLMFPFIQAVVARNEFRKQHFELTNTKDF